LNSASVRCGGVPLPLEPAFKELERAAATRSPKVWIRLDAGTTTSIGEPASSATGFRSFEKL
jgi:hypothetical protein